MEKPSSIHYFLQSSTPPSSLPSLPPRITSAHILFQTYRAQIPNSILHTPLLPCPSLSLSPTTLYLKLETEQLTNSFKLRGALHRIHTALSIGHTFFVTASTGNHALAVAHALHLLQASGIIFLPHTVKQGKLCALRHKLQGTNITIKFAGTDCLQAELAAAKYAREQGSFYISPSYDLDVIAGQGTIAVEISEALDKMSPLPRGKKCCYVTVGGGGMITGVAAFLKHAQLGEWRVVGCSPRNSAAMYKCVEAGHVTRCGVQDTLSDGSSGEIEDGAVTVELCGYLVDAWALVNESDIAKAIADVFGYHRKVLEGAAGVAVAGYRADVEWREKNGCAMAIVVACGSNIDIDTFVDIIKARR